MASIPVDLFNPGQVFACVGFLETAETLMGRAQGGFDWRNPSDVRFELEADEVANPFEALLGFLVEAEIRRYAPTGYTELAPKKSKKWKKTGPEEDHDDASLGALDFFDTFPAREGDRMVLPIRLAGTIAGELRSLTLGHWADDSTRKNFKLYAGNRSAAGIAEQMQRAIRELWRSSWEKLLAHPFDVLAPLGGSFNFDPRGAWTAIDAGYSPNDQKYRISASPIVELLAAIGLEHARPQEYEGRRVCYAAWSGLLPPMLARAALSAVPIGVRARKFEFTLDLSGKNKIVTFAQEEIGAWPRMSKA
jgi:CRISPR-associated protein Csx14